MNVTQRRRLWDLLGQRSASKEIEVGFPSASQPDFDFVRWLIEEDRIPGMSPSRYWCRREPLIKRTFEALGGARRDRNDRLQLDLDRTA